jgi:glycosyltransferase involved in cell wall biosynthesis
LPILATAVGGVPDVITERGNGLLIPPHEEGRLQAALSDLLTSPILRSALGAQARRDVSAVFALENIGQAHLALYRRITGSS